MHNVCVVCLPSHVANASALYTFHPQAPPEVPRATALGDGNSVWKVLCAPRGDAQVMHNVQLVYRNAFPLPATPHGPGMSFAKIALPQRRSFLNLTSPTMAFLLRIIEDIFHGQDAPKRNKTQPPPPPLSKSSKPPYSNGYDDFVGAVVDTDEPIDAYPRHSFDSAEFDPVTPSPMVQRNGSTRPPSSSYNPYAPKPKSFNQMDESFLSPMARPPPSSSRQGLPKLRERTVDVSVGTPSSKIPRRRTNKWLFEYQNHAQTSVDSFLPPQKPSRETAPMSSKSMSFTSSEASSSFSQSQYLSNDAPRYRSPQSTRNHALQIAKDFSSGSGCRVPPSSTVDPIKLTPVSRRSVAPPPMSIDNSRRTAAPPVPPSSTVDPIKLTPVSRRSVAPPPMSIDNSRRTAAPPVPPLSRDNSFHLQRQSVVDHRHVEPRQRIARRIPSAEASARYGSNEYMSLRPHLSPQQKPEMQQTQAMEPQQPRQSYIAPRRPLRKSPSLPEPPAMSSSSRRTSEPPRMTPSLPNIQHLDHSVDKDSPAKAIARLEHAIERGSAAHSPRHSAALWHAQAQDSKNSQTRPLHGLSLATKDRTQDRNSR
ncbi:hypothetical protein AC1031_001010 [Aphanomyces cochlioides]|nr:hypothetical protein AC1031_001010 [Aphanomyces cochlioides]